MRWQGRDESGNVEDRRGFSVGRVGGIGGIGALVLALVAVYFGQDPSTVLQEVQQGAPAQGAGPAEPYQETGREAQARHLVGVVLKDTEQAWHEIFAASGRQYEEPKLVLFTQAVESACGTAQSAVGPFYCPGDRRVYIDLGFFDELSGRFGAPGDFAKAYVVAHEVGHHVQNLLGISERADAARQRGNAQQANAVSVRLELQADCFAGIWAHNANESRQLLESGDIESGLGAASAVGDDRLQMQSRGYSVPESFTHGTSAQRMRWFKRGYDSGKTGDCNTFGKGSGL